MGSEGYTSPSNASSTSSASSGEVWRAVIAASRLPSRGDAVRLRKRVDELRAEYGNDLDDGSIAVLPSPGETHPHVLIKAKECAFDEGYRKLNW